ncbi:MAG: hypothetical protein Ta2F_05200 [Termitinemataceae bacterium]|nr:MAG: hypothetical protein Ta2F_05200 [Termitinemataceae bacterium]
MAYEIELKAWVDDPELLKQTLMKLAEFKCEYKKEDVYFINKTAKLLPSGIRIRKETISDAQKKTKETIVVTYKTKEVRGGIEINNENEFEICALNNQTPDKTFTDLLDLIGFKPAQRKTKNGFAWIYENITAELSLVEKLGYFLELEILSETDAPSVVEKSRAELLAFLEKCGIGKDKIESRYYTEMLNS